MILQRRERVLEQRRHQRSALYCHALGQFVATSGGSEKSWRAGSLAATWPSSDHAGTHAMNTHTRVLQLMVSLKTRSFPVMSADGQLVGMISREDVMRALEETTQGSR